MANNITLKVGATLALTFAYTDSNGIPPNLTGWTFTSQVRDVFLNLIASLSLTSGGTNGIVSMTPVSTAGWPCSVLYCDIKGTSPSGEITVSDTFTLTMIRGITS